MPTFLHRVHGYTLEKANLLFGVSIAVNGLVASLAGGFLSDALLRKTRAAHYLVLSLIHIYNVGEKLPSSNFLAVGR